MRGKFGFGWVVFIAFLVVQALGTVLEERITPSFAARPHLYH